jgi:O-acetyl-ADP-ribose deacetylase (regulator of RNase III)
MCSTCGIASARGVVVLGTYGKLVISAGSIVDFTGDAIVNAANEGCSGGGGVDGAINRAGTEALTRAREALPKFDGVRCRTGSAVITSGSFGDLPRHIIHAVGPNYNNGTREENDVLLGGAYSAAMGLAEAKNIKTIAFSLLCGGVFKGSRTLNEIAAIGVAAISGSMYTALEEVHIVGFTGEEASALLAAARAFTRSPDRSFWLTKYFFK